MSPEQIKELKSMINLSKIRETMNDLDIFKMIEEGTSSRVEREYLRSTEGGLKDFKQIGVGSKFAKSCGIWKETV